MAQSWLWGTQIAVNKGEYSAHKDLSRHRLFVLSILNLHLCPFNGSFKDVP